VPVPVAAASIDEELAWVDRFAASQGWIESTQVWWIPAATWDAAATVITNVSAPELHPSHLVGPADVARICGVAPSTISAHLNRGTIPEPVATISNSPLWPTALILAWDARRRQPGERDRPEPPVAVKKRQAPVRRSKPRVAAPVMTLSEMDEILEQLGA
jgi:predicted DNA-binding transcriptional regulator AlpA